MPDDTTKKAGQPTKILGDAAPEQPWLEIIALREKVAELELDKRTLQERLIEALEDAFFEIAHLVQDDSDRNGWYDSQARSTAVDVGDQLVELGILERHPDGYGRRWFYRYVAKAEDQQTAEVKDG